MDASTPDSNHAPVCSPATPSPSKTPSRLDPTAQVFAPSSSETSASLKPSMITHCSSREMVTMGAATLEETQTKILELVLRREAGSQAQAEATMIEDAVPTIEVGDVGCMLCDEGLWCPFCSPDEDLHQHSQSTPPSTSGEARVRHKPAHFLSVPRHDPETYVWMLAITCWRIQQGLPVLLEDEYELRGLITLGENRSAVERRVGDWLTGVEYGGVIEDGRSVPAVVDGRTSRG